MARLTNSEAGKVLGLKAGVPVSWAASCPYLDGAPLLPMPEDRTSSAGLGRFRTIPVKTWGADQVETIRLKAIEAKTGRYVDGKGRVWLSTQRALKNITAIYPIAYGTLWRWYNADANGKPADRRKGHKGCPYLGYRLLTTWHPAFVHDRRGLWFLDSVPAGVPGVTLTELVGALQLAKQGYYGNGQLGLQAVMRDFGWDDSQLRWWGDSCKWHHTGRLPSSKIPGGASPKDGETTVWKKADLEEVRDSLARQEGKPFDGIYDDGNRINLTTAAAELNVSPGHLARVVGKERWPTEKRKSPARPCPWERTLLKEDLPKLKEILWGQLGKPAPHGWKTSNEIEQALKLQSPWEISSLDWVLRKLRERRLLPADQFWRTMKPANGNRCKRRRIWYYDFAKFEELRAGREPSKFLAAVKKAPAPEAAPAIQARNKGGRPRDELSPALDVACYEVYQVDRLPKKLAERKLKDDFGPTAPAWSGIRYRAERYAGKEKKPFSKRS